MDLYFPLIFDVPFIKYELFVEWMRYPKRREENLEKRLHLMATILAMYPDTDTNKIAEEFGITARDVQLLAYCFRIRKSKAFRSKVNSQNSKKKVQNIKP